MIDGTRKRSLLRRAETTAADLRRGGVGRGEYRPFLSSMRRLGMSTDARSHCATVVENGGVARRSGRTEGQVEAVREHLLPIVTDETLTDEELRFVGGWIDRFLAMIQTRSPRRSRPTA